MENENMNECLGSCSYFALYNPHFTYFIFRRGNSFCKVKAIAVHNYDAIDDIPEHSAHYPIWSSFERFINTMNTEKEGKESY